jgi:hypothetical protein
VSHKKSKKSVGPTLRPAQKLKAMPPAERPGKAWCDFLTPKQREHLEEIRAEYHRNEYADKTKRQIWQFVREEFGVKISRETFGGWLREKPEKNNAKKARKKAE